MAIRQPLWHSPHEQAAAAHAMPGWDGAQLLGLWSPLGPIPMRTAFLPAGWHSRTSQTGRFSFAFPDRWSVVEEDEDCVCLRQRASLAHLLLVVRPFAGAGSLLLDEELGLQALSTSICDQLDPMQVFEMQQAGPWSDGSRHGCAVEGIIHDELFGVDFARAYVLVAVSEDAVVVAAYSRLDGSHITAEERGLIRSLVASFELYPTGAPRWLGQEVALN